MASNSILKLQVDDKQYEASLKSAQQGLQALMNALRNSGKSFSDLDKNTEQYVRALGNMEATAKTTRGRIGEMSSAFVELSQVEKQLTDQERQSPVGKALAESLEQLKQRTIEAKQGLADLDKQLTSQKAPTTTDGGGLFGGDKLSGMLQVMGGNLMTKGVALAAGAVTSMVNEIGDAVKQGVELAKAGEGIRVAFERLGRGDILDGLREATHGTVTDLELMKAAVKFNDFKLPVEELGTMLAFAQQKAKDTGQSVDYMVDSIVTGLGRKSLMILDNLGLSATEVKERMKETGDMTKAVGAIIREQMAKAGEYVETAADRAAQANVSMQNKMEELGRKFAPVEEASNQLWTSMKIGILDVIGGPLANLLNKLTEAGRMANAYGLMGGNAKVGRMTSNLAGASAGNRQSIYNQQVSEFMKYISPREQQIKDIRAWQSGQRGEALQGRIGAITDKYGSLDATKIQAEVDAAKKMLADYQQAAQKILKPIEQKIIPTFDSSTGGTTGGGGKSGTKTEQTELQQNQTKINALTQEYVKLSNESTEAARERQVEIQKEIEQLKQINGLLALRAEQAQGRMLAGAGDFQKEGLKTNGTLFADPTAADSKAMELTGTLSLQLDADAMEAVNEQITKSLKKDAKVMQKEWALVSESVSNIGNAFASIEDPGAKAMGTVIQAIASIALGFAQASVQAGSLGPIGWLAWLAAGTAAMATTISTVHSLTGYADGGIVKGNHYSGDNINGGEAMVNAGELVLNKAQQSTLASQLQDGNGDSGGYLPSHVSGEQIYVVLNRYLKRTGRGELVTWE